MIVVALLLFLPIRIFAAGDHEKRSCGNAVGMDITAWRGGEAGDHYFETAFRACTTERVNRLAEAVAVISVTILALTLISAARRNAGGPLPPAERS
jgi:TRAP-type uncharacterized transport system fused permease subunit